MAEIIKYEMKSIMPGNVLLKLYFFPTPSHTGSRSEHHPLQTIEYITTMTVNKAIFVTKVIFPA